MSAADEQSFVSQRFYMVDRDLRARGIRDQRVLEAMLRVPRHEFIPEKYREQAYEDHPLPIGEEQTISQPYIVALMLEALELTPADKVLEIGAGSGYATALLAELAGQVFSIERHETLATEARRVLTAVGYGNVKVLTGDGSQGLASCAPFDAILVSAAARHLPRVLVEQLPESGRMIIPVGAPDAQELWHVCIQNGEPVITRREACRFVPLISPGQDAQ